MVEFDSNLIKVKNVRFNLTIWSKDKIVWLNHFIIPKKSRKQGIGSKIMIEYCKWLDNNDYNSKLLVSNCYGTPEDILIKFYQKFGFTIDKDNKKNIYMTRKYQSFNNCERKDNV